MNKIKALISLVTATVATLLIAACEGSSANSIERNVGVDYTGFYRGSNDGNQIPNKNSGTPVTFMNVRQTGAKLEAVDNTGFIWNGQIENNPSADNLQAVFTLKGRTTAGNDVTISGNLSKDSAGSTTARMSGTWIEPDFYAIVVAVGTVSATSTNSGGGTLSISPSTTTVALSSSQTFTAAGASGTITWSVSGGGTLSATTGTTTTFTRSSAGTVTLTATSSGGGSATATIN